MAIDNAKRKFDIDLSQEIRRIKNDMNVKDNGYPIFWTLIRNDFNKKRINNNLKCPMNYLFSVKLKEYKPKDKTLPMSYFFNKFELEKNRKTCKKVEEFIEKYSLDLYNYNRKQDDIIDRNDDYILLRSDFEDMIKDIQKIYISKNYLGLMSWLVDRAFNITNYQNAKKRLNLTKSKLESNKSILLNTLFRINKNNFLKVLSGNNTF